MLGDVVIVRTKRHEIAAYVRNHPSAFEQLVQTGWQRAGGIRLYLLSRVIHIYFRSSNNKFCNAVIFWVAVGIVQ